jgi:Ca-activated chloride channel family protein
MKRCAREDRLTPFLLGDLPEAEAAEFRQHLAHCDACQQLARELEPILSTLRTALAKDASNEPHLDSSRHEKLLAVQPRSPWLGYVINRKKHFAHWAAQPRPWLRVAACIIVVTGIFAGIIIGGAQQVIKTARCRAGARLGLDLNPKEAIDAVNCPAAVGMAKPAEEKTEIFNCLVSGTPASSGGDALKDISDARAQCDPFAAPAAAAVKVDAEAWAAPNRAYYYSDYAQPGAAPAAAATPAPTVTRLGSGYATAGKDKSASPYGRPDGAADMPQPVAEAGRKMDAKYKNEVCKNPTTPKNPSSSFAHGANAQTAWNGTPPVMGRMVDKAEQVDTIQEAQQSLAKAANEPGDGFETVAGGIGLGTGDPDLVDKGFEIGPAVKDRLVMKGLYSSRTAGGRMGALSKWGSADDEQTKNGESEKRAVEKLQDRDAKDQSYAFAGYYQPAADYKKAAPRLRSAENRQAQAAVTMNVDKSMYEDGDGISDLVTTDPIGGSGEVVEMAMQDQQAAQEMPQDIDRRLKANATAKPGQLTEKFGRLPVAQMQQAAASQDAARSPKQPRAKAHSLNPFVVTAGNKFSTFGIDVSTASYTLTRAALRNGQLPEPDVVRTEAIINSFDFGDVAPEKAMFRIYLEGAPSPFGEPGLTLLRIGVKGKHFGREEQRASVLTFLIDTSGSMDQPDRIGRARLALKLLLDQLAPVDRVQIVAFDNQSRVVLGPTPATEKAKILAAFDHLQCNGSTNLEDGMRQAYQQAAHAFMPGAENRILLISDGVANLGSDNAQDILKQIEKFRHQGISFSVYGVGQGSYDDAMLQDLANKGDGVYRFLDSDEEVRRAFVDDLAATLNTIATDVKIQVEWSPDAVKRYRQLGYESRALTAEQFRDDSVTAGGVGSGQAVTAMYELDLTPGIKRLPLGTVHVRYRRADTHAVEEIEQPITAECIVSNIQKTRSQFRLAVSAAAFAEMLRGSQYVSGYKYSDVAQMLRPVALDLSLDQRVKELLSLVENADALSR